MGVKSKFSAYICVLFLNKLSSQTILLNMCSQFPFLTSMFCLIEAINKHNKGLTGDNLINLNDLYIIYFSLAKQTRIRHIAYTGKQYNTGITYITGFMEF